MNQPLYPLHQAAPSAARKPLRRSSQLLPLEQRFMFDAAVADAAHAAQVHDAAVAAAVPAAVLVRAAEPAKDEGKKEVVLVNTALANYKALEAGVRDGVGIVEFDGSKDGLAQIAQWAVQEGGYDAIHILTHGAEGVLDLGTTRLDSAALNASEIQAELTQLGQALSADGDLLLYGCDIASGQGAELLAGLAQATGADVAASTDATGAARLGGNWTLEAHRGAIEARALSLTDYDSLLSTVSLSSGYTNGSTSFIKTADGVNLTYTIVSEALDPLNDPSSFQQDGGGLWAYGGNGNDYGGTFTISAPTGYVFDLTSLTGVTDGTVTLHATYANGSSQPDASYSNSSQDGNGNTITATYTFSTLNNMTSLTIHSAPANGLQNGYANFTSMTIAVRALAPATTVASATLQYDTGTYNNDFITNVASNTISGTLSAPLTATQKVEVSYDNGNSWSNASSYSTGSASWSTNVTLAGANVFKVRVAETYNGGTSYNGGTEFSKNYRLDTTAPTIGFSNVRLSNDNGSSNTDLITNQQSQTVYATLSSTLDSGDTVLASTDGGNSFFNVTSLIGSGTGLTWNSRTLQNGNSSLVFKVIDEAGNEGTPTTAAYTIDTVAPTATISGIALSADTGTPGDLITKTAAQTISGNLSASLGANETVYVSVNNGAWLAASTSGTAWTLSNATLSGTASTIRAKVIDLAGNDGAIASANYTLDTTPPAITISSIQISNDSNITTDFITNMASQTITATLSGAPDGTDIVYGSVDNGNNWFNLTSKVSGTTLTWDNATLNGSSSILLKVTDNAANDGTVASQSYTLDTSAPATPNTPTLAAGSDTGVSSSDKLTNDSTPTLSGTAEAGSTVTIYDGATQLGTTVATGGVWSYTTAALSGASHSFTVTASDTAGNVSGASGALAVTLDTTAPAIASVAVPANGSYGAGATLSFSVHTDDIVYVDTSGGTPRLQLTIGATTRYASYVSGSGSDTLVFSYTVQAGESDSDGIAVNGYSANSGSVTDAAGNALAAALNGLASTAAVLVDTTAPATTSVAVPANGTYYTGDPLSFTINFNEAVFVDTSSGTPRLSMVVGLATRYATYVSGSGTSALVFSYTVVNGDTDSNGVTIGTLDTASGTLRDAAGNDATLALNSVGSTANVLVDGLQPGVTSISASTGNGAYGAGATITITLDFSAAVDVDTTGGTPTLALDSGGTATYSGGSGSATLSFSYTVGAGQNSADLDVSSTSALALNGATITESAGAHRNVSIALAAPGTAGSLGANQAIVIDTTAPSIAGSTVSFSDDTGSSATDLITSQAGQTEIKGTLDGALGAGETVMVSLDNGASWITATAAGSDWSIGARTLSGSNTIKVYVRDAAGNTGSTASFAYVLDQTAPGTTFGTIRFSDDSGVSSTDLNTNVAAQTITATLSAAPAAGEKVFGSLDGGNTWTDITSQVSGTALSWTGVTLAASNTLQFYVRDVAGNDGAVTSKAYVLDTTAPVTSIASIQFSADTGFSNSDFITKTGSQTISGTLSANLQAGEAVYVSTNNGGSWSVATSDGLTGWSIANRTLTAGADTLLVKVSDTAGNDGPVISQGYTCDTTPPAAATVTPLTTTSLTPVLSGSAALAAGDSLTVTVGGATYDVTPVAGAWTLDLATAVPASGTLTLVLNTQYNVTATVTDVAGNSSTDASNGELIVGTIATPPTAPTTSAGGATLSNDSGASGSDLITNVAAQTISGSLSAPLRNGESVQVSLDGGTTWRTASASGSSWSIGATLSGSNTLQVRVSNAAGSGPLYSQAYTLDTTPPAAPAVDAVVSSSLTPLLSGAATLADGETLTVSVGGADYAVSVVNGRWTLDLASATPAGGSLSLALGGSYTVLASVTDLAGNWTSGSAALTVATLPQIGGLALSADTGSSSTDFITSVAAQTLSGTLSAPLLTGQSVQVSADGGATWRSATVSGASWSASVTLSGSNTLLARVTSAAGAGPAVRQAYVLDTVAPAATPVLTALTGGGVSGTLSAPLGAGETLLASTDGGASWTAVGVSGGGWSLAGANGGSVQLLVRDTAGNSGAVLVVNTAVPPPPQILPLQPLLPLLPATPVTIGDAPAAAPLLTPGPVNIATLAPLVLPLTGAGGDLATGWPGQPLAPVLDTLPSLVALRLAPDLNTASDSYRILTLPELPGGGAPVAYTPIPDVRGAIGERISVQVGSDAFAHSGDNANVELSAQSADGTPLPGWIRFDARTARFEGTPPAGFEGTLSFKVIARDSQGRVATQVFKIIISRDGARVGDKTGQLHGEPADPVGRASLGEQMRNARSAAAARLVALAT